MEIESKPSLYDRLGGVYNIAVVIPKPEQEELKAIVESTRESIVVAPLAQSGK